MARDQRLASQAGYLADASVSRLRDAPFVTNALNTRGAR